MITKISNLSRALYIVLAIVAGFIALGPLNVPLVLVVLGLVAGLSMPRERMILAGVLLIALPIIGSALGMLPVIGAQLTAVAANLQTALAGALASAVAILLYELVVEGVTGFAGDEAKTKAATA